MSNSVWTQLNNTAVDALHAGDLQKGYKILSHTFFDAVRNRHKVHKLTSGDGPNSSTPSPSALEFSLHDCSRGLYRCLSTGCSSSSSEYSHQFLCLHFLRMNIPAVDDGAKRVDQLCSCAVAWALGYNLSIVYALLGFQRGSESSGSALMKKAARTLTPIKRQIMLQRSNSPFWTNLKLAILNNHICIQRERGTMDIRSSVSAMEDLLRKSRSHLDPLDVKKFYLSLQFLDFCNSLAAAA